MRNLLLTVGFLALAIGLLWIGQGTGVIAWPQSSFMISEIQWAGYGVALAAVGLILSTVVSMSKKSLSGKFDFVFIALTVIAVNRLHLGVSRTLIAVGLLAILFHRPRKQQKESGTQ